MLPAKISSATYLSKTPEPSYNAVDVPSQERDVSDPNSASSNLENQTVGSCLECKELGEQHDGYTCPSTMPLDESKLPIAVDGYTTTASRPGTQDAVCSQISTCGEVHQSSYAADGDVGSGETSSPSLGAFLGSSSTDSGLHVDYQRLTPPPSSSPLDNLSQQIYRTSSPIPQLEGKDFTHRGLPGASDKRQNVSSNDIEDNLIAGSSGKRKRSKSLSITEQSLDSAPNPKRLTVKSQLLQYAKLKSPFRSPLLIRVDGGQEEMAKPTLGKSKAPLGPAQAFQPTGTPEVDRAKEARQNYRTARAAAQFKSPLSLDGVSKIGNMVRMTPDVQALERKLQALKRAIRIKERNQEEGLEVLAQKWTDAGREVACELWSLFKDSCVLQNEWSRESGSRWCQLAHGREDFESRAGNGDSLGAGNIHRSDKDPLDRTDQDIIIEEPEQNSLGVMLRRLGIDPRTLGCEDEEDKL